MILADPSEPRGLGATQNPQDASQELNPEHKERKVQQQPLVSVVTPVYNGEPYLAECIASILNQTYENWEYVLVNNCSEDASLDTMRRYAAQDPRIRVHDNDEFLGQFQNWNLSMRLISSESKYCKVIHADDWIYADCIAEMVALAEDHPSVGIVGAYRLTGSQVDLDSIPCIEPRRATVLPGRELCRSILLGDTPPPFGSPTSLLLRSDLVRSRTQFYDESVLHADVDVCYDLLQDCDFGFVHRVLTFTRMHEASITSRTIRFQTGRLANYGYLVRYGPVYLSQDEYATQLSKKQEYYYRFLSRSVFEQKGKAFWKFQRESLAEIGHPVHGPTLALGVLRELLDPRQAVRRWRVARRENRRQRDYAATFDAVVNSVVTRSDDEGASLEA